MPDNYVTKMTPQQSRVRQAKEAGAAIARQEAENNESLKGYNYSVVPGRGPAKPVGK